MAQSLDQIRNSILTSIFGRRLGLDPASYLCGPRDIRKEVTDMTSASSGMIPASGIVDILATSAFTSAVPFQLAPPVTGVSVKIANLNANSSAGSPGSTALTIVRSSSLFNIISTDGSTETTINITPGSAVELTGLSTIAYLVTGRTSLVGTPINGTT